MLEALFWLLVGALIGWHVPQPEWAKMLTMKMLGFTKKKDE